MTTAVSPQHYLDNAQHHSRKGDFISACDKAMEGIKVFPDDIKLKHQAVLSLARSGALENATTLYHQWQLGTVADEDCLALGGRLAKDEALTALGPQRQQRFQHAAEKYAAVYTQTGTYYPAINAATLYLLAGQTTQATTLAKQVLQLLVNQPTNYYALATKAEAHLLLQNLDDFQQATIAAMAAAEQRWDQVSTTRKQLQLICEHLHLEPQILDNMQAPAVAHFCGHMLKPDANPLFPVEHIEQVKEAVNKAIKQHNIHFGFGSAASGADLLIAEALLAHQHEVTLVLPFNQQEFCDISVRPAGEAWVQRFQQVCAQVQQQGKLLQITDDGYQGDNQLFVYSSEYAMGLARLRARQLGAQAMQLAIFSGEGDPQGAGTAGDIQRWQACGLPSVRIASRPGQAASAQLCDTQTPTVAKTPSSNSSSNHISNNSRELRALLFADVKGFTSFSEAQLPHFYSDILTPIGQVLDKMGDAVQYRNTWGDALYAVFSSVDAAATTATQLQAIMQGLKGRGTTLPENVALRIGLHYGPVYQGFDAARQATTFYGTEVSKTARIEPITPPGQTYATEAFAAALALQQSSRFQAEYAGRVPLAKNYGAFRMYHIKPLAPDTKPALT